MSKKKCSERENSAEGSPKVYRIAELKGSEPTTRRKFITSALKSLGISTLLSSSIGCGDGDTEVDLFLNKDGECSCHMVCTCDTVDDDESSNWGSDYTGTVCTCDLVCTCNTVCTCDSEGGGGGHYWYPC